LRPFAGIYPCLELSLVTLTPPLQTNVFVLGNTFLKLVKALHLNLPIVDPSLYISRFASLLELGPKTHAVAQDAMRLAQRMNRDWIHIGRKPSGISGACNFYPKRV
jgi:transcription factor IIIB subunit 2